MSVPKPAKGASGSVRRPAPSVADYCDEIDEQTLQHIKDCAVVASESDDEWELKDGPAW
jgi:hypothetical protein